MIDPIETIKAIDVKPYRKARQLMFEHEKAKREANDGLKDASRLANAALRLRAKNIVEPHFIEWHDANNVSIDHKSWEVRPHLAGEIMPANHGPFTKWARATIRFSITGTDMKEFDEVFYGLKDAADALAKMLYQGKGQE